MRKSRGFKDITAGNKKIKTIDFAKKIKQFYNSKIEVLEMRDLQHYLRYDWRYVKLNKKFKYLDNQDMFWQYGIEVSLCGSEGRFRFIFTGVNNVRMQIHDYSRLTWMNQDIISLGRGLYHIKIYVNDNDSVSFKFKSIKEIKEQA